MSDDGLDELYQGALETFVKRRDALAAERKKAGDKAGAAAVKALTKPPLSAHGVNRLWATRRDDFDALLAAGEGLREAVRSGVGDAVREAQKRQRALVSALRDVAGELLSAEGHAANAGTLDKMGKTLGAVSTRGNFTPGVAGRLAVDIDPPGLDELMDVVVLAAPPPPAKAPPPPAAPPAPAVDGPTEDERRAQAEAAEREERRRRLAETARRADEEVELARAALEDAERARQSHERDVRDLSTRLETARETLADAASQVEREKARVAERTKASDEARAALAGA